MSQLNAAFAAPVSLGPFVSPCTSLCHRSLSTIRRTVTKSYRRVRMCASPESGNTVPPATDQEDQPKGPFAALRRFMSRRGALRAEALRNYGVAVLISYGMFDTLTYSLSFLFSLRAYLAAGKVLTWKTLPQVLALMWGINNLSRPFRIAGALALAPFVDRRIVKPFGKFLARLRTGSKPS